LLQAKALEVSLRKHVLFNLNNNTTQITTQDKVKVKHTVNKLTKYNIPMIIFTSISQAPIKLTNINSRYIITNSTLCPKGTPWGALWGSPC